MISERHFLFWVPCMSYWSRWKEISVYFGPDFYQRRKELTRKVWNHFHLSIVFDNFIWLSRKFASFFTSRVNERPFHGINMVGRRHLEVFRKTFLIRCKAVHSTQTIYLNALRNNFFKRNESSLTSEVQWWSRELVRQKYSLPARY